MGNQQLKFILMGAYEDVQFTSDFYDKELLKTMDWFIIAQTNLKHKEKTLACPNSSNS